MVSILKIGLQTSLQTLIPRFLKTPCTSNKSKLHEWFKGDGGVGTFDVGGGDPALIFGSNLPIFWLHA